MRCVSAAIVALIGAMAVATALVTSVRAQTVQELEPLSFGTFVVTSNAAASTLTVPLNGAVSSTGNLIVLVPGNRARYRVGGLPGNTIVGIDINSLPLFGATVPASQFCQITAFSHPLTVTTNASGEAIFFVGATLSTSGNGVPYTDNTYTGMIDITATLQ